MPFKNEIALRPRFKFGINKNNETVLNAFEQAKSTQSLFIITRINNHVFIRKSNEYRQFWSPQLQIEINAIEENSCIVRGFMGPSPTVWTLFMFLHFMVAGLFIAFGIWAYVNLSIEISYAIQISFMLLMIIVWFLLYFIGRLGKESCNKEVYELRDFMHKIVYLKNKPQIEANLELIENLN